VRKIDAAIKCWNKAVELSPELSFPLYNLGLAYLSKGNKIKSFFNTRFWGIATATIEDLAFEVWPSREVDEVSRPRCLSTRQEKDTSYVMKMSIRRMK